MARAIKHPVVAEDANGDVIVADGDVDTRDEIRAAERAEFGGMKFGSAFFGWLTAAGVSVLLTALAAAILTALGFSAEDVGDSVARVSTLGIAGAIAVAVVVFIAYFAGGYVAGRMARFSGALQGFAVWLWAIIFAFLGAGLAFLFGERFDILGQLEAFPRIPIRTDEVTVAGIVTAVVLAAIPLVAAVLGGMAGMRYHRRVDRAGMDAMDDTVVVEEA
jgi:hypothetical protein